MRSFDNSRVDAQQQQKSRSALMDVFKTHREPNTPPTPQSWSRQSQRDGGRGGWQNNDAMSQGREMLSKSRGGLRENPEPFDARGSSAIAPPRNRLAPAASQRKDSFSARKSRSIDQAIKNSGYTLSNPSAESMMAPRPGNRRTPESQRSGQQQDAFWAELDEKVAQQQKGRRLGRSMREPAKSVDIQDSDIAPPPDNQQTRERRVSRVGREEEKDRRVSGFEREDENDRRFSRFGRGEENDGRDRYSRKTPKGPAKRRGSRDVEDYNDDYDWDAASAEAWKLRERKRVAKQQKEELALQQSKDAVPILLPEFINVSSLADALEQGSMTFLRELLEMGFEDLSMDSVMTGETAALIAQEYGFEPTVNDGAKRDLFPRPTPEDMSTLPQRPPVVTIMGHVDHGKTTLLDWLRKSSVAAQEHGGITQHIGAFVVKMSTGKPITFLDTPGHAAFLSMRQRGANATDIVVLVVAADDSVMPQTLEALKHARAAKVPIIVAINKIDKEAARPDQVKADLARQGVEIEDYGGDVQVVCVSGKTGQGMQDLEESILTLSEVLDVRAETDGMAEGYVLESNIKQDGKAATVLVKRGTLRTGDLIVAGRSWAKIRVLRNEAGIDIDEVPPGTPAEVLGWRELPQAGEPILQAPDEDKARTAVGYRQEMKDRERGSAQLAEQQRQQREKVAAEEAEAARAEDLKMGIEPEEEPEKPGVIIQNFVVKADVVGSVEAVCGSILEQGNNEINPKILRSAAGPVNESDVDHAAVSSSLIVNFNLAVPPHIKQRAQDAGVRIMDQSVIYHVVDEVREAMAERLPKLVIQSVTGEAEVLQVFPINVKKRVFRNIAGCRVRNGLVKRGSLVKVLRRGKIIFTGTSRWSVAGGLGCRKYANLGDRQNRHP